MGHAYTTIVCDVVHRYYKMLGTDSYFLTGTDEHGDKIAKSAEKAGKSPQEFTDGYSQKFRELLPVISASNDDFIRTTEERHKKVVQELLQKVYDKKDIYFDEYTGKYCVGCERYLADDELVEGKCPDHKKEPDLITEKNYFFKMSKYWQQLKDYVLANPDFITPEGYRKELLGLLETEPQDLCISRPKSRLTWGVELPFDKDFVSYVWFDALINYISALGYPNDAKFKKYWPVSHHMIAKDILRPHCLYWPTMLMSMEIPLPHRVCIHGYWLMGDAKMSKSTGEVINPLDYCSKYGPDIFRYYLLRAMHFGRDANFNNEDFKKNYNADLANKIGNLYSRIVGICRKRCDGKIPGLSKNEALDDALKANAFKLPELTLAAFDQWRTFDYLKVVVEFSEQVNKYLDDTKPWTLIKDPEQFDRASTILRHGLEAVRILFGWLSPVMPATSKQVYKELGLELSEQQLFGTLKEWDQLTTGTVLPEKLTGFPRIQE